MSSPQTIETQTTQPPRRTKKKGKGPKEKADDRGYAQWRKDDSDVLLQLLYDACLAHWRNSNGGFSKATINDRILPVLNQRQKSKYDFRSYTSRWKYFREKWAKFEEMKRFSSGFGWDAVNRTFTAPNEVWDDYLKSHPTHRSLRHESNSDYELLQVVVGQVASTGDRMRGLDGFHNDAVREPRGTQNDERDHGDFSSMRDDAEYGDDVDDEADGDSQFPPGFGYVDVDGDADGDGEGDEDMISAPSASHPILESDASAIPSGVPYEGGRNSDSSTRSAKKRSRDSTTSSKGTGAREFDFEKISESVSRMCETIGELTEIMSGSKAERARERVEKSKKRMEKSKEREEKSRMRALKMNTGWEELCGMESVAPDARYFLMDILHKDKRTLAMFLAMNDADRLRWVNYKLNISATPYFPHPP